MLGVASEHVVQPFKHMRRFTGPHRSPDRRHAQCASIMRRTRDDLVLQKTVGMSLLSDPLRCNLFCKDMTLRIQILGYWPRFTISSSRVASLHSCGGQLGLDVVKARDHQCLAQTGALVHDRRAQDLGVIALGKDACRA